MLNANPQTPRRLGTVLDRLPGYLSPHPHKNQPDPLRRVLSGVMRHAQSGDLPLFAWSLGLEQNELLLLVEQCFPELGQLEPMTKREYAILLKTTPERFGQLANLLLTYIDLPVDITAAQSQAARQTGKWIAHAIAAACMGERHLWQDLGLTNHDEISALLRAFFPALHARNTQHAKPEMEAFPFQRIGYQSRLARLTSSWMQRLYTEGVMFQTTSNSTHIMKLGILNASLKKLAEPPV